MRQNNSPVSSLISSQCCYLLYTPPATQLLLHADSNECEGGEEEDLGVTSQARIFQSDGCRNISTTADRRKNREIDRMSSEKIFF